MKRYKKIKCMNCDLIFTCKYIKLFSRNKTIDICPYCDISQKSLKIKM